MRYLGLPIKVKKYWNLKIVGIPSAIILLLKTVWLRLLSIINTIIHKPNLGKCGTKVSIYRGVSFRYPSTILLGNNVKIGYNTRIYNDEIPIGILNIGDRVTISNDCVIDYSGGLEIGSFSHVAYGVSIITHTHGCDPHSKAIAAPLKVGQNVFLGAKCIISQSVRNIGDHAVIASGAVVTRDVPPYAVVGGNPAEIIKYKKEEH